MHDRALTIWLCEQLGEIAGWKWSETDSYSASVVGVYYGRISTDTARGVGVRIYGGTDDRETGVKTRRVQLRFRGGPSATDGADILADQAFDRFDDLFRVGVISEVVRQSFSPAGSDTNQREERTDNYLIDFDNPEG
ncbi:minor capsid protein [Microbacterium sp. BDGP8]|uniref:phage tail terminator protein n=1 Tax=Microbacterium sp. BDGP8 TaxID=3035531 RepID=UPI00249EADB1|nr:minor capsid protein [Microbacterium sp. BDGP8]WHE35151.1 minor capsid protein [Microbacterium sp. BDGP8]